MLFTCIPGPVFHCVGGWLASLYIAAEVITTVALVDEVALFHQHSRAVMRRYASLRREVIRLHCSLNSQIPYHHDRYALKWCSCKESTNTFLQEPNVSFSLRHMIIRIGQIEICMDLVIKPFEKRLVFLICMNVTYGVTHLVIKPDD